MKNHSSHPNIKLGELIKSYLSTKRNKSEQEAITDLLRRVRKVEKGLLTRQLQFGMPTIDSAGGAGGSGGSGGDVPLFSEDVFRRIPRLENAPDMSTFGLLLAGSAELVSLPSGSREWEIVEFNNNEYREIVRETYIIRSEMAYSQEEEEQNPFLHQPCTLYKDNKLVYKYYMVSEELLQDQPGPFVGEVDEDTGEMFYSAYTTILLQTTLTDEEISSNEILRYIQLDYTKENSNFTRRTDRQMMKEMAKKEAINLVVFSKPNRKSEMMQAINDEYTL